MTHVSNSMHESISALADGELEPTAQAQVLGALLSAPEAQTTWHAYHVVGDVLRSGELAPAASELAFLERVQAAIANEPAFPNFQQLTKPLAADPQQATMVRDAANASVFRWKALASVACISLVGVLAWNLNKPGLDDSAVQAQGNVPVENLAVQMPAVAPAPMVAQSQEVAEQGMLRDAELDALLAAHQQLGGHSALQTPSGFLRNATYERPAR
jgi:sigma-E factor negative regulatory protein RseA